MESECKPRYGCDDAFKTSSNKKTIYPSLRNCINRWGKPSKCTLAGKGVKKIKRHSPVRNQQQTSHFAYLWIDTRGVEGGARLTIMPSQAPCRCGAFWRRYAPRAILGTCLKKGGWTRNYNSLFGTRCGAFMCHIRNFHNYFHNFSKMKGGYENPPPLLIWCGRPYRS